MIFGLNKYVFVGGNGLYKTENEGTLTNFQKSTVFATYSHKQVAKKDGGWIELTGFGAINPGSSTQFSLNLVMEKPDIVSATIPLIVNQTLTPAQSTIYVRFKVSIPVASYMSSFMGYNRTIVESSLFSGGTLTSFTDTVATFFEDPALTSDNSVVNFKLSGSATGQSSPICVFTNLCAEYKEIGS